MEKIKTFIIGMLGGGFVLFIFSLLDVISGDNSITDWLSAVGTMLAVWISLWLARDKTNNKPISISSFDTKEHIYNLTEYDFEKGEHVDVQGRYRIEYKGSVLLYNPSDFPKSLYDIKISTEYKEADMKHIVVNDEGKEVTYITLKPKDLIVLNYNFQMEDVDDPDYPFDSIIPYSMFIVGKTEESEITKKEIELKNKKTPT